MSWKSVRISKFDKESQPAAPPAITEVKQTDPNTGLVTEQVTIQQQPKQPKKVGPVAPRAPKGTGTGGGAGTSQI